MMPLELKLPTLLISGFCLSGSVPLTFAVIIIPVVVFSVINWSAIEMRAEERRGGAFSIHRA
jgi:hypothetical protein